MTTVDQERAKRIYYNQRAIAAAGANKQAKYGGLVFGVKEPAGLMDGRSIGVIAVTDDVYEQLSKDEQYNPVLAAIPDGNSFKQLGNESSDNQQKTKQPEVEHIDEDMPTELFFEKLENLLGDSLK